MHTNRYESKNAQHKRNVVIGNNRINVLKTMAKNENYMNGLLKYFGWFKEDYLTIVKLSCEIETFDPYYSYLKKYVKDGEILCDKILYKNTEYACGTKSCILTHKDDKKSTFGFGIITKIILKKTKDSEICLFSLA